MNKLRLSLGYGSGVGVERGTPGTRAGNLAPGTCPLIGSGSVRHETLRPRPEGLGQRLAQATRLMEGYRLVNAALA